MSINRHLARGIALQVLFELDMNEGLNLREEDLEKVVERHLNEFANIKEGQTDTFVFNLLKSIQERLSTIDEIISRAAPEWPIEKINIIDRNILRLGLTELLFSDADQVPPKVAIDEAIELAKNYGGETSHKFVNGVLGAIYKEMGEPGKDQVSQKKTKQIEMQSLAGALVYSKVEGKIFFAFVKDIFKYWTLPKGKLIEGEDDRVGAIRKIKEEVGINVVIKDNLKENSYIANTEGNIEGNKVRKSVIYFLAEAKHEPLILEKDKTGITEAKWFPLDEIEDLKMYSDIKSIIKLGLEKIN